MNIKPDWLPNIHPLIIHFPIAILIIAVLVDFLTLATRDKYPWLQKSAALLYITGVLSVIAAFITGHIAEDTVNITFAAGQVFESHEEYALITLLYFIILTSVRTILQYKFEILRKKLILLLFLAGLAGLFLLYKTAENGGKLVYFHGIGIHTNY